MFDRWLAMTYSTSVQSLLSTQASSLFRVSIGKCFIDHLLPQSSGFRDCSGVTASLRGLCCSNLGFALALFGLLSLVLLLLFSSQIILESGHILPCDCSESFSVSCIF